MGAIIWLASYPKSGNTWVRAFLHNLLRNPDKPADINALDRFCMGEDKAQYYNHFDKRPCGEMSPEDIAALRPKVHRLLTEASPDSVFVKTHNYMGTAADTPLVTMEHTAGAIYIMRNPLDVVISYSHHYGYTIDEAIMSMADSGSGTVTTDINVRQVFSTWSRHVESWTANPSASLYVARYEDMHHKPFKTFGNLAKFLGLKPPKKRLQRAIANASFKTLSKQEDEHGFVERSEHTRFFRSGKIGQWRDRLTPEQVAKIIDDHRETMTKHGYLKPDGTPAF